MNAFQTMIIRAHKCVHAFVHTKKSCVFNVFEIFFFQVVFGERIRPSSYNVRVWCILMYQKKILGFLCLFFDILVCE